MVTEDRLQEKIGINMVTEKRIQKEDRDNQKY